MEKTERGYRLRSGREFRNRIVGLDPDSLSLSGGYDFAATEADPDWYEDEERWTPEERRELGAFMIEAWTRFVARDDEKGGA